MDENRTFRLGANPESELGYIRKFDQWIKLADGTITCYDLWLPNPRKFPGKRPAIVRMHGNGRDGTYETHAAEAVKWVDTFGIIVMFPDFRGQGRWLTRYNPPAGAGGPWTVTQLSDIAEFIKLCKALPECNGTVGTYGNSQGGIAATMSAAYSGKAFPEYAYAKGWYGRAEKFPTVACACSIGWGANPRNAVLPNTTQMGFKFEEALVTPQPASWNPSRRGEAQGTRWGNIYSAYYGAVTTNDVDAVAAYLDDADGDQGGVAQGITANLAASTVPTLFRWAYDDVWRPWQTSYEDVLAMGSNAFISISPGGHFSNYVSQETAWHTAQYNAFFEYHLLGTNNNSNLNAFGGTDWDDKHEMRLCVPPAAEATRNSNAYTWPYKWVNDKDNFLDFTTTPLYIRANGTLNTTAESAEEESTDLEQVWNDTDYSHQDWIDDIQAMASGNGNIITTLLGGQTPKLDPATVSVRLAATATDYVIAGRPVATLFVESDKAEFMVAAALFDYDSGSGDETFITHGWVHVTDYESGIEELTIEMAPCCYEVIGTRQIQLRVSTYPVDGFFRPNGSSLYLYTRPIFGTDGEYTITVHHDTDYQSNVALPLFADGTSVLDA